MILTNINNLNGDEINSITIQRISKHNIFIDKNLIKEYEVFINGFVCTFNQELANTLKNKCLLTLWGVADDGVSYNAEQDLFIWFNNIDEALKNHDLLGYHLKKNNSVFDFMPSSSISSVKPIIITSKNKVDSSLTTNISETVCVNNDLVENKIYFSKGRIITFKESLTGVLKKKCLVVCFDKENKAMFTWFDDVDEASKCKKNELGYHKPEISVLGWQNYENNIRESLLTGRKRNDL